MDVVDWCDDCWVTCLSGCIGCRSLLGELVMVVILGETVCGVIVAVAVVAATVSSV